MMNEKEFKRLLSLYLDGELSTEEIIQLKEAVIESPGLRHQFQDEIRLHTQLRELISEKIEEKKISENTRKKASKKSKNKKPIPVLAYIFSAVAAIAVAAIITGYTISVSRGNPVAVCVEIPNEGIHEVIRNEEVLSLQRDMKLYANDMIFSKGGGGALLSLNDWSMVSLENETQIKLVENDDSDISIFQGKILLEVNKRKNTESPFLVKTADSRVTVLGTIFSVKADEYGYTKVDVYEGQVKVKRLKDSKEVKLDTDESVITSDPLMSITAINEDPQDEIIKIYPTDDVHTEGRKVLNSKQLKVRKDNRVIYLRFNLDSVGSVKKAVLYLSQEIDPGKGTLSFHTADSSNWSEKLVNFNNLPKSKELIAKRTGTVASGKRIAVDLSKGIKGDGLYTIIVTIDKGDAHDIWFSSKEGVNPPVLEITR